MFIGQYSIIDDNHKFNVEIFFKSTSQLLSYLKQLPFQEKLMGQIRDSRFSSLNQIREQARENLDTEQNIKLMEEKKLLMGRSNDKITEKTEKLRLDVTDIEGT